VNGRRGIVALVIVAAVAAVAGAVFHWQLWDGESAAVLMLGVASLLVLAVIVGVTGLLARVRPLRIGAVVLLVAGIGMVVGIVAGPSREPLMQQFGGTMTLTLDSPVAATATGPADCTNVASGTEFSVSGDANMRLETPDRPFVMVFANGGDRWAARSDAPRSDGIRFQIEIQPQAVPADGKPTSGVYVATSASKVETTFDRDGGRIRFSGLAPQVTSMPVMPYEGTLEWTCGPVLG